MSNALLIPSYEPRERVVDFLMQFKEGEFDYFLVVDDGSGDKYSKIFAEIAQKTVFEVISYPTNKGKGHALKHGLKHLLAAHPDLELVVTADSDGQHLHEDILKVKEAGIANPDRLVLGSRDFREAPKKSQSGNLWSSRYFWLLTGARIRDTQTGLRGIPSCLFDLFAKTPGDRFEFEMTFLLDAAQMADLEQVEIVTVYENGKNEGTHFRPFIDSIRIAGNLIGYVLSFIYFIVAGIVCYSIFAKMFEPVTFNFLDLLLAGMKTHGVTLAIAGIPTYLVLQFIIFHNKVPFYRSLWKYMAFLLGFFVFECALSLLTPTLGYPLTWLISISTSLFAILKCVLDYRHSFALKRIHK